MKFDVLCTLSNRLQRALPYTASQTGDRIVLTVRKEDIPQDVQRIDVRPDDFTAPAGSDGYIACSASCGTGDLLCPFTPRADGEWVFTVPILPLSGLKRDGFCAAAMVLSGNLELSHVVSVENGTYRLSFRFDYEAPAYEDVVIVIHILHGDDADYSGMARAYRGEQIARGEVRPLIERMKERPELRHAADTLYIRIRQAWKPVPSPVPEQTIENEPPMHVAVTFRRAGELMDAYRRAGVEDADFCLVGWNRKGHDGRYPQLFPVEPELGGEEGLRALIEHARSLGYSIDCHTNSTDAYRIADTFDEDELIVKRDGTVSRNNMGWSAGNMYHLCAVPGLRRAREDFPKVADLGFHGLHYIDVISTVWPRACYNPHHPQNRRETAENWLRILRLARETFGGAASEGCFDMYVREMDYGLYQSFNLLGDMPEIAARRVPLWSLVYHGVVLSNPSAETVNYPAKTWRERLKCYEYGGRPAIYVHSAFVDGRKTNWMGDLDILAGTDEQLERGAQQVRRAYDDYQPLKYLQTQFMDKHEQLAPDVYRVTYSGGDSMIFNYAETDYDYDGHIVPAHDYILIKA